MITTITPEQIAKFPQYVREWTKIGTCTDPADRPRAEAAIRAMYRGAGLSEPVIIWTESPLSMVLASVGESVRASVWESVGASVGESVGASVGASVWESVRASVWESVGESVGASVRASVWASVGASVRASVRASVWESVRESVWASVRASVWASVGASVRASVRASVWESVYGQHEAGWLSFYRFFHDECGLVDQTEKLSGLWELCQSSGWILPCKNVCFASERHHICALDGRGLIHAETGPAIAYRDGFEIYAWHGTRIPAEWITDKASLTPQIALTWGNIEQRRAAMEIIGWARMLRELKAKVIHDSADPETGTLVEVDLPGNEQQRAVKARFLHVLCGTKREFALGVPPDTKTAEAAQTWLFGETAYTKPEIRT